VPVELSKAHGQLKVFVTLGTIRPYKFDSLVDKLMQIIPSTWDVVWQLGESVQMDVRGTKFKTIASDDFDRYVQWSDIVISHSGVGSALRILELGKQPILVPRRSSRGEHVDDHQEQVAYELAKLGISKVAEVDELTCGLLEDAATSRIISCDI
jgi:UDP-N-acetylglucosamine transferase subunit ALG13